MSDVDALTLQEAADVLGLHQATVYRHVRLGLLPAHRRGRAWVVTRDDLEAFRRSRMPVTELDDRSQRHADWSLRLQGRLLAGDRWGAKAVIDTALTAGCDPVDLYVEVTAPAMRAIGDGWAAGAVDVGQEHRASVIVGQLLALLDSRLARWGRTRGTVVAGAVAGERHALALRIVTGVLRIGRFEVQDLGADVPVRSFARVATSIEGLVAVAVSASTTGNEGAVRATVDALHDEVAAPVLVGGGAVADEAASQALGGDGWAADARGVLELVGAFQPG